MWLLKLKGDDPVDPEEYRQFLREALKVEEQRKRSNKESAVMVVGVGAQEAQAKNASGTPAKTKGESTSMNKTTGAETKINTTTGTTTPLMPRIIWMYWAQGEGDPSLSARDVLEIQNRTGIR